jgi:hypothetical protein
LFAETSGVSLCGSSIIPMIIAAKARAKWDRSLCSQLIISNRPTDYVFNLCAFNRR